MSLALTLARIAQLETAFTPAAPSGAAPAGGSTAFAGALTQAIASGGSPATALAAPPALGASSLLAASGAAPPIVTIAQAEVGQAEQPPGSNDSPRIAQYRQATAGSGVGPWCAYFVSWAARQAGTPLGDHGEGFGSVDALYAWAQRSGRAVAAGPGVVPRAGDLIVFHEHIGLVESVLPDGRVQTIEGNSSDQVARRVHAPGDAVGYVRMS